LSFNNIKVLEAHIYQMEEKDELMGEGVHALAHQGISMSRQQEMKN